MKLKVSIVVSTYNEEKNIETLLKSCTEQTYKNLEIIVVDSARTTDKTVELSKKYTEKVFTFGNERSPQRNYGVKKANGDYVLILDADMALDKKVIEECVKVAATTNADALIVPEKSYGQNFWAKARALERNCYIGDETIEAARFFKKSVYQDLGGFNPKMISGEDWDLTVRARKKNYKISRIHKNYINHNEGHLTYFGTLKKKMYYANKADEYVSQNVGGLKDILNYLFRPAYFRNWRKLIRKPILTIAFLFLKYSEFFVAGFFSIALRPTFWKKIFKPSNNNKN